MKAKKMNRLFVPTNKKPFLHFSKGDKKWEVRKNKGKFSSQNIYHGQIVEIRKGYSSDNSIWGKISSILFSKNTKDILDKIHFEEITPWVSEKRKSSEILDDLLGESAEGYVAFKLDLSIPIIDLDRVYKNRVLNGDKVTTIRKGNRNYKPGPALFNINGDKIPIDICGLEKIRFNKITEADAKRDGFECIDELKNALTKYYPNISTNDKVTIVNFRTRKSV